jgi:hypothetical protein
MNEGKRRWNARKVNENLVIGKRLKAVSKPVSSASRDCRDEPRSQVGHVWDISSLLHSTTFMQVPSIDELDGVILASDWRDNSESSNSLRFPWNLTSSPKTDVNNNSYKSLLVSAFWLPAIPLFSPTQYVLPDRPQTSRISKQ